MAQTFRYRYVDFGTSFTGDPRTAARRAGTKRLELCSPTSWSPTSAEPAGAPTSRCRSSITISCASPSSLPPRRPYCTKPAKFASDSAIRTWSGWSRTRSRTSTLSVRCTWRAGSSKTRVPRSIGNGTGYIPTAGSICLTARRSTGSIPISRLVPPEHRWAFLLASYASVLETRRRISCPRAACFALRPVRRTQARPRLSRARPAAPPSSSTRFGLSCSSDN